MGKKTYPDFFGVKYNMVYWNEYNQVLMKCQAQYNYTFKWDDSQFPITREVANKIVIQKTKHLQIYLCCVSQQKINGHCWVQNYMNHTTWLKWCNRKNKTGTNTKTNLMQRTDTKCLVVISFRKWNNTYSIKMLPHNNVIRFCSLKQSKPHRKRKRLIKIIKFWVIKACYTFTKKWYFLLLKRSMVGPHVNGSKHNS